MDLDDEVQWKMSRVPAHWQLGGTGTKPAVCTQREGTGEPVHSGPAEKVVSHPHQEELPPGEPELVPGNRIGNQ